LKLARIKFKLWKDEDSKKEIKVAKKKFRKEQRRCVFVFEEGRNNNIENLFNKPSKEKFWKSLSEFKNTKNESCISETISELLKKSISNLFQLDNEKIIGDWEKVETVIAVDNYEKESRENFNNK
jgi:polynucleotide 5'-kinase involved in rRNA processing